MINLGLQAVSLSKSDAAWPETSKNTLYQNIYYHQPLARNLLCGRKLYRSHCLAQKNVVCVRQNRLFGGAMAQKGSGLLSKWCLGHTP